MRTKITHVAIKFKDVIYSLPSPNRHNDVIRLIVEKTGASYVDVKEDCQGFLDENGTYLNRKQALVNASLHNQIKDRNNIRCNMLFSEDLW